MVQSSATVQHDLVDGWRRGFGGGKTRYLEVMIIMTTEMTMNMVIMVICITVMMILTFLHQECKKLQKLQKVKVQILKLDQICGPKLLVFLYFANIYDAGVIEKI